MRDLVIDLGDVGKATGVPQPRPSLIWSRHLTTLLVMVLALVTLTASRPGAASDPAFTGLGPIAGVPDGFQFWVLHGAIVVLGGDQRVTAYEPDGRVRWTVAPQELPAVIRRVVPIWDRLGVVGDFGTVALDPDTGARRWAVDGWPLQDAAAGTRLSSRVLMVDGDRLRIYDAATGQPVWATPKLQGFGLSTAGDAVLGLSGDLLSWYDLGTGDVSRSGKLELASSDPDYPGVQRISEVGDLIVAHSFVGYSATWFHRDTLQPLDTAAPSLPNWWQCGPLLCAIAADYDERLLVDPQSWEVVRRFPFDLAVLATPAGLLSVTYREANEAVTEELMDPTTAQTLQVLPQWRVVNVLPEDHSPVAEMVLTKQIGKQLTYLAVLDAAGFQPIGRVPHHVHRCAYQASTLACRVDSGELRVWQLNH